MGVPRSRPKHENPKHYINNFAKLRYIILSSFGVKQYKPGFCPALIQLSTEDQAIAISRFPCNTHFLVKLVAINIPIYT